MTIKYIFALAGSLAFVGVGLGAIGSHLLKSSVPPESLIVYEIGNRYHIIHAMAIFISGLLYNFSPKKEFKISSYLFMFGIIIFSGSLYTLAITGVKKFGMITPIGGLLFLIGWIFIIVGCTKSKFNDEK
jgi:uncharacterized membrane protein YgdD (TMEM256/DUF423 family)